MAKKRGNDAIPSWSGYNYQGKITLLCSLNEINRIVSTGLTDCTFDGCYVEVEKTDDFVIFVSGKAKALYQVKAYLSSNKISSFWGAMGKLVKHRNDICALTAKCYLCTPKEISDWNDPVNIYLGQVDHYNYNGNLINIDEVASKIEDEIETLLISIGKSTSNKHNIYLGICEFLDEKVACMHKQETKRRNYNINFKEIFEFIVNAQEDYVAKKIAYEKEHIYEHIIKNIKECVDEYCDNCENKKYGTCKKDINGVCSITKSYDYLLEINIWEYCKYINPHMNSGWEEQLNYVERLKKDDIGKLLLPIFYNISENDLYSNSETIYCNTDLFKTAKNKVIPTLLSFDCGYNDVEKATSNILSKIKQNEYLSTSTITGCTITADTKGYQYNTQEDSILYFDREDKNEITNNDNYIKIVDGKEFIETIGGNKDARFICKNNINS